MRLVARRIFFIFERMRKMKKAVALLIALSCIMPMAAAPDVWAAEVAGTKTVATKRPPKRRMMTDEEKVTILVGKYNISTEKAAKLAQRKESFRDVERAVFYAALSGKSEEDLLSMNKKDPWSRVQYKLKISPEAYNRAILLARAERLSRWWGIDEGAAREYLEEGYPMHWIKVAWVLSRHSSWMMDQILESRRKDVSWKEWAAAHLQITPETYDAWIGEYKNPAYIPGIYF